MNALTPELFDWLKGTKVVNSDGSPKLVYHGTSADFDEFDLEKAAMGIIWFSSDAGTVLRGDAGACTSGRLVKAYVKITRPAGWEEYDRLLLDQITREFDGVILPRKNGEFDCFVFSPDQVRIVSNDPVPKQRRDK